MPNGLYPYRLHTCAPQNLELHGCALYTCDAQSDATVVYLVVAVVLEQRVRDLCQAEALLAVNNKADDLWRVK